MRWIILLLILTLAACQATQPVELPPDEVPVVPVQVEPQDCPKDLKNCPDGTLLERQLPSCKFPDCPSMPVVPTEVKPIEVPKPVNPPKSNTESLETVTYDLLPGANLIPLNMRTGLDTQDIFDSATCSPTKMWLDIVDDSRLSYYPGKRTEVKPGENPISLKENELYMLWCEEEGNLTITGTPIYSFSLPRGNGHFVTPPSGSITAKRIDELATCDMRILIIDFVITNDDGNIISLDGNSYKPTTQNRDGWTVEGQKYILTTCILDGTLKIPK